MSFEVKVLHQLERMERKLNLLFVGEKIIMAAIDDLEAEVRAESNTVDSAIILLNGLSEQLKNAAQDPARVLALASEVKNKAASLGAAIVANTPAGSPARRP